MLILVGRTSTGLQSAQVKNRNKIKNAAINHTQASEIKYLAVNTDVSVSSRAS